MKSYDNTYHLEERVQYVKYSWYKCGVLKVIPFLLELKLDCEKFYCLLREWDSRAREKSVLRETIATLTSIDSRADNNSEPLVSPAKLFFPLNLV
jgi:hypothetical protein